MLAQQSFQPRTFHHEAQPSTATTEIQWIFLFFVIGKLIPHTRIADVSRTGFAVPPQHGKLTSDRLAAGEERSLELR